jgi:hypothetical protein
LIVLKLIVQINCFAAEGAQNIAGKVRYDAKTTNECITPGYLPA